LFIPIHVVMSRNSCGSVRDSRDDIRQGRLEGWSEGERLSVSLFEFAARVVRHARVEGRRLQRNSPALQGRKVKPVELKSDELDSENDTLALAGLGDDVFSGEVVARQRGAGWPSVGVFGGGAGVVTGS
jgi:hypothetical protein